MVILSKFSTQHRTIPVPLYLKKSTIAIITGVIFTLAPKNNAAESFSAYLFAYFTGNDKSQETICFALSEDGYNYKAINKGKPIVSSAAISSTGGVRDPHILRGENNDYYMVATDMVSANGWASNRAMVLLRSTNLTDWTSSVVNIPKTYSQFALADRIWAPQTIFDPAVGKYMVYFAMRLGSADFDKIYYAYANSSFTALESAPKILFTNNGLSAIDADIISKDNSYYLFFKTEGNGNGIKSAVSSNLTSGYVLYDKYLQQTTAAVEGSCVFKLINSSSYILMYDMYTSSKYQFTTSTDLKNFTVSPTACSFDFTPRHGTVIPITSAEKQALNVKWNPTQVLSNQKKRTLRISPFVANGVLHLGAEASVSDITVLLFDLSGKEIIHQTVTNGRSQIRISDLSSGVYELQCIAKTGKLSSNRIFVR